MENIVMGEHEEDQEFEKDYRGFNDPPPNFKGITEEEFASSAFFQYTPEKMDYKQVHINDEIIFLKMFVLFDGTGYGIAPSKDHKRVRYFSFAKCDHNYQELSSTEARKKGHDHYGMFCHVYECKKCGFVISQDSSG